MQLQLAVKFLTDVSAETFSNWTLLSCSPFHQRKNKSSYWMLGRHCKLSVSLCYCPTSEDKVDRAMGHCYAWSTAAYRSRSHLSLNWFFLGKNNIGLAKAPTPEWGRCLCVYPALLESFAACAERLASGSYAASSTQAGKIKWYLGTDPHFVYIYVFFCICVYTHRILYVLCIQHLIYICMYL